MPRYRGIGMPRAKKKKADEDAEQLKDFIESLRELEAESKGMSEEPAPLIAAKMFP